MSESDGLEKLQDAVEALKGRGEQLEIKDVGVEDAE